MQFAFSAPEFALQQALEEIARDIKQAQQGAVLDAAAEAVEKGRENIAAAGFSARWQGGLRAKLYPNPGGDPAAFIYHRIGYAGVFETGATIGGKPLLWLPIEDNLPPNIRSPRKYRRKLVSVNIAGKPPLLFDAEKRIRGPLFVGVRSVTLRKRWDLYRIFAAVAERMHDFFEERMRKLRG